jgi:ankyrin repeat protein
MIKLLPQAQTNMLSFLGSILSWKTTRRLNSIQSSSRVAAVLSVIMPEEQEGQHFQLAEKLCKAHTFPAHELLEVLLFILSNNLDLQGFDSFSNRQKKDELVMQIFHLSGLNNVQNVKYLLAQSDAIAEAVVEKLFGCAMRSYDITAIQLLLEAGINPNMPIPTHTRGPLPPLSVTAYISDKELSMEIAALLMAHGAELNSATGTKSPLACAIERHNCELVKLFLCEGATFLQEMLPSSLMTDPAPSDLKIIEVLLAAGAKIQNSSRRDFFHGRLTLIGVAVRIHNSELLNLLLSWGTDIERIQTYRFKKVDGNTAFENTTPLGVAAAVGNMGSLRALLAAGAKVNVDMSLIPPLVLAVEYGHSDATRLLLSEGADVSRADYFRAVGASEASKESTFLTRALRRNHPELCWTLIEAGSRADYIQWENLLSLQLIHSIKNNRIEWVSRLLKMGAPIDWETPGHQHDHPLALAIAQGNCEVISLLSNAGAKLTQGIVCSIADIHTANHLTQIGLMPSLLRFGGRQALVSAILLDKQDLAMNLLSCNADRRDLSESPSLICPEWAMFKTPLEAAICGGDLKLAELLINRGASVTDVEVWRVLEWNDIVDFSPFWNLLCSWQPLAPTAIGMALSKGDHALVRRLLAAGVDLQGRPTAYDQLKINNWIEENYCGAFVLDGPRHGMKAGWWNCHIPDAIHPHSVLEIAAGSSNGQFMLRKICSDIPGRAKIKAAP